MQVESICGIAEQLYEQFTQVESIFGVLQSNYMSSLHRYNLSLVDCRATRLHGQFTQVESFAGLLHTNFMRKDTS